MSIYGSFDDVRSDSSCSSLASKFRKKRKVNNQDRNHSSGKPKLPGISVGVAYDINNKPISVNTCGSVMPDVTSEVDLNTTSGTDVEDKKQYEPNILEKALERTICYHPRRRAKASTLTISLLCILTTVFNAAILIISPIYTSSMRKAGGDEMIVLLSVAGVVPAPMVVLTLILKHAYDKTITLRPTASTPLYAALGVCLALRLNMGIFASNPHRTPHALQPGLSSVIIPFTVVATIIILRKGVSKRRLACCVIALIGVFIAVEPRIWSLEGSDQGDLFYHDDLVKQIAWPAIFCMSFLPLAIYNVAAETELKKNVIHSFSLSTSGLLSASVFTVVMFGFNFLPWYGHATDFPEFWESIKNGFECNFRYTPLDAHCLVKLIVLAGSVAGLNIFSFLLISATEGSVFTSLVMCLAAPLASGFWTLFDYDYDTDDMTWSPQWTHTTAFTLGSVALLLPAVIMYSVFSIKDAKDAKREQKGYSDVSSSEYEWD